MTERPAYDCYKHIETPEGTQLELCPVCFAPGELWRYSDAPDEPTTTAVMCSNGKYFGPQNGEAGSGGCGCLLYLAPIEFHRNTMRDAVAYWNAFAQAITNQRLARLLTLKVEDDRE